MSFKSFRDYMIIFSIKLMFTDSFKNRFDLNNAESNILMTQIRAEKKLYKKKNAVVLTSQRENRGKKVYQEVLFRPSLSPSVKENYPFNASGPQRISKIALESVPLLSERSRSGRRMFENTYKKDQQERASI